MRKKTRAEGGESRVAIVSSIVALTISLISGGYNLIGYFEKPRLRLLAPEQVTILREKDGPPYVSMVTDFVVFNDARPEKVGVVTRETISFVVDGKMRKLRWQEMGRWKQDAFESERPVLAFSVGGGAVAGHEASFHPRSKMSGELQSADQIDDNWVGWELFLRELDKGNLRLHCVAEFGDGGSSSAVVELDITDGVKEALHDPQKSWAPVSCHSYVPSSPARTPANFFQ